MPRDDSALRKNHRPRNITGPAEQFSIDEVADAPETESDRGGGGAKVRNLPKIPTFLTGHVPRGQNHADESAMKRHAALPNGHDGERLADVAGKIIEEDITDAAADHHT